MAILKQLPISSQHRRKEVRPSWPLDKAPIGSGTSQDLGHRLDG